MPKNPLAEVFGYPVGNMSQEAVNHRQGKFCPFHNSSGLNCIKNSATDPLGVCTIVAGDELAITCPIRLRQDLLIVADAARFFFPEQTRYVTLSKMRVKDEQGRTVGHIDLVLAILDEDNAILNFGALEVLSLCPSGNLNKLFTEYMKDPTTNYVMTWPGSDYPKPDYAASHQQLVSQLMNKISILHQQGKKTAIAIQRPFFEWLPLLPGVSETEADIAWFVYDLEYVSILDRYKLKRMGAKYTKFRDTVKQWQWPV